MGAQAGGKGGEDAVEWHLRPPNSKNPMAFFYDPVCRLLAGRLKIELVADIAP